MTADCRMLCYEFQCKPQSRNRQIINLHKKCGVSADSRKSAYCDSISQKTNSANTFELSQCWHCKERLLEPRKGFWVTSGSLSPRTAASICSV